MKAYKCPTVNDQNRKWKAIVKLNTIKEHFQNHFNDNSHESIESTHIFHYKITNDEVKKNIMKLNNSRALQVDQISAEIIKYGPIPLHSTITTVLYECISNNINIEIRFGLSNVIQKPNTLKGRVANLRLLTLLPLIQKILSNILLSRIKDEVGRYLSQAQSAYRNSCSTGEIVWAYRWMIAITKIVKDKILVTGIDLRSAFDTINRNKLIEIIKEIVDEHELIIIKYSLQNT